MMPYSKISPKYPGFLRTKPPVLQRHVTSSLTTFVVGSKEIEFSLHSSLLSTLSVQFRDIAEGSERYVRLEHVDKDVFSRFAQFVYSETYVDFDLNEQDELGTSDRVDITNRVEGKPGNAMLPNTPNFSPTSLDARKSQHSFNFAPNDGPKCLSCGPPLNTHKEDVPLDLFGEPLGTASLILEQTPARFLFSFASSVTATENGSGCIYSNQTASKARVPIKRKQPSGTCSCELHKSGQCENKKRLFSNFFQSHLPMFRFDQNTQVPTFDPQTENFKNVLIGHARVWSFAKEFAVTSLMKLARCNLAWQLVHWVMSEHTFMPIFGDLVRFVYNGCTVEGDDLRLILAQFAACVSEEVCVLGGWYKLIAEVPSFVVDVMRELAIRCEGDFGVSLLD